MGIADSRRSFVLVPVSKKSTRADLARCEQGENMAAKKASKKSRGKATSAGESKRGATRSVARTAKKVASANSRVRKQSNSRASAARKSPVGPGSKKAAQAKARKAAVKRGSTRNVAGKKTVVKKSSTSPMSGSPRTKQSRPGGDILSKARDVLNAVIAGVGAGAATVVDRSNEVVTPAREKTSEGETHPEE